MTPQQIFGTALRVLALIVLVWSVKYLLGIPATLKDLKIGTDPTLSYAIGAVYLLLSAALWFFPMWIAHKIIPRTKFDNYLNIQPLEAARVGAALIGLWFFASALPSLAWYIFSFFTIYGEQSAFQSMATDTKLDILSYIVQVVFSLVLMFRSTDFARLIVRPAAAGAGKE